MKKLIALTLTLSLSLSVTALAAEISQDSDPQEVKTEITTSIEPTYTVTIPENVTVDFNENITDFGAIKLTAAQLEPDCAVRVKLDAGGELKNAADENKTIPYAIRVKDTDEEFTSAEYLTAGASTALTIEITQEAWDAAYAGDYSDTVTFTITYGAVTP